jgi:hypothetical protein
MDCGNYFMTARPLLSYITAPIDAGGLAISEAVGLG